jgi:hypothetical protein
MKFSLTIEIGGGSSKTVAKVKDSKLFQGLKTKATKVKNGIANATDEFKKGYNSEDSSEDTVSA